MSSLPPDVSPLAFIDPQGHNRDQIEALMQQVLALLLEEATQAEARSPLPQALSHDQLESWAHIPAQSVGIDELLKRVRSQLQHAMNAAHPGYIGHMDSIPTTMSVLGDLLVGALNNNMLSVEMSPVFSRLEPLVLQKIAQRFGLGEHAGGVLVSGGSLANLQALTVARNIAFDAVDTGVVGLAHQPVFFVSEVAHTSMKKAAMMMGLGAKAAISVRANANAQMDINDLKEKLARSHQSEQQPFAIVATAGTTVTGNIDPLTEIGKIARTHGLWFHVDAAYGGALIFSDTYRNRLSGIEAADSVTFNPQKWLYVTKTCAAVLFRKLDVLNQHFRIRAPYMGDDEAWPNLGELTVQGTRHPDILKLWLSLQHIGTAGYDAIIQHSYALCHHFVQAVKARPFLQLASEPQMNLVCFRFAPEGIAASERDRLNANLQQYLLTASNTHQNAVFLSLPTYRSEYCSGRWLKAVLLNPYTTLATLDSLFSRIDAFAHSRSILNC